MQPELHFKCPSCGGSAFGSMAENLEDPSGPLHRYCHGNDAQDGRDGCRFDWPEKDDWKYFQLNNAPLTEREYEATMDQIHSTMSSGIGPIREI